jgi:probable F420-dependent oxidoreductase
MTDRAFRFGIVAAQASSGAGWAGIARRVEDLGFSNLLVPDTMHTLSPVAACAAAAAVTETLHVGAYVLSAPNRAPGQVGHEAATMATLTDGRYELGIGAGRPGADKDAAVFGRPFGSAGLRIDLVRDTVAAVRAAAPGVPVMVAGSGPKMLSMAAEVADTVALGLPPEAGEAELSGAVDRLREAGRFDELEVCLNLLAIGDQLPAEMARFVRLDLPALLAAGSVNVLAGSVDDMCSALQRRRDESGVSYVCINAAFLEALAPVVERLSGR